MALVATTSRPGAWDVARARLLDKVSDNDRQLLERATPESIFYEASVGHDEYGARSKVQRLQKRLRPLTDALEQYGEALDVYANASSTILCPLWGSIRLLLKWSRASQDCQDKIIAMFAEIGSSLPQLQAYEKLFPESLVLRNLTADIYVIVSDFCLSIRELVQSNSGNPSARFALKALARPFDHCLQDTLDKLRKQGDEIRQQSLIEHMSREKAEWTALQQRQTEDQRNRILNRLFVFDYLQRHRMLCQARHRGTCKWIDDSPAFVAWLDGKWSKGLIIEGIPGCGKSVATSYIIEKLLNAQDQMNTKKHAVCYHHCDYADVRTLSQASIFSSLSFQLLEKVKIMKEVGVLLDTKTFANLDVDTALTIFESACNCFESVTLLLDGLDELEDIVPRAVLKCLSGFTTTITGFRFAISCRTQTRSVRIEASRLDKISLSGTIIDADIGAYINETIAAKIETGEMLSLGLDLQNEILVALQKGADNMFLWAKLQIEALCSAHSPAEVRAYLKTLPKDLDGTYSRMLERLTNLEYSEDLVRPRLEKCFSWVLFSKRPLSIMEIREAIAIDEGDRYLDGRKLFTDDGHRLIESCANFLMCDRVTGAVRLVHHTAFQFLCRLNTRGTLGFSIAESLVAKSLITYLHFDCFRDRQLVQSRRSRSTKASPSIVTSDISQKILQVTTAATSGCRSLVPWGLLGYATTPDKSPSSFIDPVAATSVIRMSLDRALDRSYALLQYTKENWAHHAKTIYGDPQKAFYVERLWPLILRNGIRIEYRPWMSSAIAHESESTEKSLFELFDWTINESHLLFFKMLLEYDDDKFRRRLFTSAWARDGSLLNQVWSCDSTNFIRLFYEQILVCLGHNPERASQGTLILAAKRDSSFVACFLELHGHRDAILDYSFYDEVAEVAIKLLSNDDWNSVVNLINGVQVDYLFKRKVGLKRRMVKLILETPGYYIIKKYEQAFETFIQDRMSGCAERFCFCIAGAARSQELMEKAVQLAQSQHAMIEAWLSTIEDNEYYLSRIIAKKIEPDSTLFNKGLFKSIVFTGDLSSLLLLVRSAHCTDTGCQQLRPCLQELVDETLMFMSGGRPPVKLHYSLLPYRTLVKLAKCRVLDEILIFSRLFLEVINARGMEYDDDLPQSSMDIETVKEYEDVFLLLLLQKSAEEWDFPTRQGLPEKLVCGWTHPAHDVWNHFVALVHWLTHTPTTLPLEARRGVEIKALQVTKNYELYEPGAHLGKSKCFFDKDACFICASYAMLPPIFDAEARVDVVYKGSLPGYKITAQTNGGRDR